MKVLAYWRKNYLWGVARPAVLSWDGQTLTCVDNALATVFSAPLSSLRVEKGFGIFKVFVDGSRVAYLTPTGGSTAPEPSVALRQYLQRPADTRSAGEAGASAASGVGGLVGGVAGAGLDAVAGAAEQVFATAQYVTGMKGLTTYFTSIGALQP